LKSFRVEDEDEGQSRGDGKLWPAAPMHVVLVVKGLLRFVDNAHFGPEMRWEQNPERNQIYYTGDRLDVYFPNHRYFETSEENAKLIYALKVRVDLFLECLGLWPEGDGEPPENTAALFLHEALNESDCRVLPALEAVDGVWCHVVERPGKEKIWIDAGHGWRMRRREFYAGSPPLVSHRYELSDYREVEPGAWLPWKYGRVLYSFPPGGGEPQVLSEVKTTVKAMEINRVADDTFRFTPPPGTIIQNRDNREFTRIPGGLSYLDGVVDDTRTRIPAAAQPADPWKVYGLLSINGVLAGLIVWQLWRTVRGRLRPSRAPSRGLPRA
jgi:hypothetical protein